MRLVIFLSFLGLWVAQLRATEVNLLPILTFEKMVEQVRVQLDQKGFELRYAPELYNGGEALDNPKSSNRRFILALKDMAYGKDIIVFSFLFLDSRIELISYNTRDNRKQKSRHVSFDHKTDIVKSLNNVLTAQGFIDLVQSSATGMFEQTEIEKTKKQLKADLSTFFESVQYDLETSLNIQRDYTETIVTDLSEYKEIEKDYLKEYKTAAGFGFLAILGSVGFLAHQIIDPGHVLANFPLLFTISSIYLAKNKSLDVISKKERLANALETAKKPLNDALAREKGHEKLINIIRKYVNINCQNKLHSKETSR